MSAPRTAARHRYRVASVDDVRRLPPPRLAPARVEVELAVDGIDEARRAELERRLARELAVCGCREGSIAVLAYLVLVPLLAALGPLRPHSLLGWSALVGGVLVASIAGKVVGLALARIRLLRAAADVETAFREAAVS